MAKQILLDSDVVIDELRGNPRANSTLGQAIQNGHVLCTTPIAWAEVYAGIRKDEEKPVSLFFGSIETIPLTAAIGRKAGDYLRRYQKSHSVQIADALIAATAFIEQLPLFTRNRKHYPMADIEFFEHD